MFEQKMNMTHLMLKALPYDEIKENMLDKNKTIFVYCQSGTRSKIAYQKLLDLGFKVYDLKAYEDIQLLKE